MKEIACLGERVSPFFLSDGLVFHTQLACYYFNAGEHYYFMYRT